MEDIEDLLYLVFHFYVNNMELFLYFANASWYSAVLAFT